LVEKILQNKLLFIILHLVFGYFGTLPFFSTIFGLIVVSLPIYILIVAKNSNEEALIFSAYLVGVEVFIRMTKGFFLYETGKYSVIIFLSCGILLGEFKQRFSVQYIYYILLLLLGIVFTQVPEGESIRNSIAFNLSGPILLGVAALYFYQRPIDREKLLDSMFFMLLPLFSMISYLYFRTPDLKEIVFRGSANFETSGGFGPNQVATAIGLGIFIITIFILCKKKLTGYLFLDYIFLMYFIYRGLITFSRGGILTVAVALILFSLFYIIHKRVSLGIFFKYILTAGFFILAIWFYTSNITGGMLNNRYTGKNASGIQKKDISSGRVDIFAVQFKKFIDTPLGIGVGNGKYERKKSLKKVTAASHNEVGRLLEEHGSIGFILLILLLTVPLFNFFRSSNYQRAFIISFYVFWFLTINHSAMRIALPAFIYFLSLIHITGYYEE